MQFGDRHSILQHLKVNACEHTKIVHSTAVVENCQHLFFRCNALELLH